MSANREAPEFAPSKSEAGTSSYLPWAIAGVAVLAVLGAILLTSHRTTAPSNALLPLDPSAQSLVFSGIEMSESESLSGAKVTYIDGHVRNAGAKTVTGAQLQVVFSNDSQMPPQLESVPLNVIRTHEPYIDTEPLSAAPLAAGEVREFRLPFENISENWNQQLPAIRVTHLEMR